MEKQEEEETLVALQCVCMGTPGTLPSSWSCVSQLLCWHLEVFNARRISLNGNMNLLQLDGHMCLRGQFKSNTY